MDANERIQFKNSEIVSNDDVIVYKTNLTQINNIPINEGDRLLFTYEIGEFDVNKIYYIVEVNKGLLKFSLEYIQKLTEGKTSQTYMLNQGLKQMLKQMFP